MKFGHMDEPQKMHMETLHTNVLHGEIARVRWKRLVSSSRRRGLAGFCEHGEGICRQDCSRYKVNAAYKSHAWGRKIPWSTAFVMNWAPPKLRPAEW